MEQLIDLLRKYIVLNKTICKDIQGAISEVSSDDFSEEDLLDYYETIPSEDKSLIYACLAKILNYKEYLLYKDIEKIARKWDEIEVGSITFHVPYLINDNNLKTLLEKYKPAKFSRKLYNCLNLAATGKVVEDKEKDTNVYKYEDIDELVKTLSKKIKKPTLEPFMAMSRKGKPKENGYYCGKTFCDVPSQIATEIYEAWKKIYNKENNLGDEKFLEIFSNFNKDISKFFKTFLIGVDCSGYVNQVYGQWMLDQYTQRKLNTGEIKKEMAKTIGPNRDNLEKEINEKDICRDNCILLKEEKKEIIKKKKVVKVVNFSLYHIGYFFLNTYLNNNKKKKNRLDENVKYKRNGSRNYSPDGDFNSKDAEAVVKSNLKAGDLICLEHNTTSEIGHYVIVEKTGINEQGQWYFCVTESTTVPKKSWIYSEGKREKITEEWDGVRHNQGYYTSIEEFINTRESGYEFFWFCRPKAIAEYYNSNNIIEYKEEES